VEALNDLEDSYKLRRSPSTQPAELLMKKNEEILSELVLEYPVLHVIPNFLESLPNTLDG
jgi:hypothetical protein